MVIHTHHNGRRWSVKKTSVPMVRTRNSANKDLSLFFYANPFPLVVSVPQTGLIVDANAAAIDFFQFPKFWHNGIRLTDFFHDAGEYSKIIRILKSGGQVRDIPMEIVINGQLKYVLMYYSLINLKGRTLLLNGLTDVTEEHLLEMRLDHIASIDELTELYNRRKAFELLEERYLLARVEQVGFEISFLDINLLKMTNDQFGHRVGDALIRVCAQLLRQTANSDCQISRLGGDEFMVVHPIDSAGAGQRFGTMLQLNIDAFNHKNHLPCPVSMSHGVSVYNPAKQESISQLVERADAAMYLNKQETGRKPHFRS